VKAPFDGVESAWQIPLGRMLETATQLFQTPQHRTDCSARELVWQKDKAALYRYLPLQGVKSARVRPILICYALVNRPDVLDLQADRSLIRRLLAAGLPVYLLDWGRPDDSDRSLELADYIEGYLHGAIQSLLGSGRVRSINLLGVCQGGTLSLCYTALHPRSVANLVTMVTPVDFQTPDDLLSKWARKLDTESIRRTGNLRGAALTTIFLALRPFRLMHQKYVDLLLQPPDPQALETFRRMEGWIFDSPDQAATALAQFVCWFYQENRLLAGKLTVRGRAVELRKIRQPVLNIFAQRDHIVPPAASRALRDCLGATDYSEFPVDTGHIGIYVSRQSQSHVAATIAHWLRARS
jgi:poly[(R)-3-hydroxyalkanoate] polymerase subunit PhaC